MIVCCKRILRIFLLCNLHVCSHSYARMHFRACTYANPFYLCDENRKVLGCSSDKQRASSRTDTHAYTFTPRVSLSKCASIFLCCCIFQVMKTDKSLASASSSSSSDKRKSAIADADKKKVAIRYEKSKDIAGRLVSPITAVLFTHTRHCG